MFFGFAFGMGGLGAAVLGETADHLGIEAVYRICAWLPAIGLLAWFLPRIPGSASQRQQGLITLVRNPGSPAKGAGSNAVWEPPIRGVYSKLDSSM